MPARDYFSRSDHPCARHTWAGFEAVDDADLLGALAQEMAQLMMGLQCHQCEHVFNDWLSCAVGNRPAPDVTLGARSAFVSLMVGIPGDELPANHLEACVAEHLWYMLASEMALDEVVEHIPKPSISPLDHGMDGLTVYRTDDGQVHFRLWEIKKNTSDGTVSDTVREAYQQLIDRGMEYLAKHVSTSAALEDGELAALMGHAMEHWEQRSALAGAGVSVATNISQLPRRCFSTFADHFPDLASAEQRRGAIKAMVDFPAFARTVRDELWRGL